MSPSSKFTEEELEELDSMYIEEVYDAVESIAFRLNTPIDEQFNKYGPQRISSLSWVAVIVEELGEAISEYNKGNQEAFEYELLQMIACCARLLAETRREQENVHIVEEELYERHS